MFGKHHLFKLVAAIVVAASIAVVGARTAKAGNSYNPRSVSTARHAKAARVQGLRFITDTLGGNGQLRTIPGLGGRAVPA